MWRAPQRKRPVRADGEGSKIGRREPECRAPRRAQVPGRVLAAAVRPKRLDLLGTGANGHEGRFWRGTRQGGRAAGADNVWSRPAAEPTCSYACRMLCSAPSRRGGENIPVRSFRRKRRGPPCPTAPTRAAPSTICTRKSNSFTQNLDNSSRTIGCRGARVAHLSSDFRDLAVQSHV